MSWLFILWMYILPVVAILLIALFPIFVFLLMPPLARRITWKRFSDCVVIPIATDAGYVDFQFAQRGDLPEGMVDTKRGPRLLPRPIWQTRKERKKQKQPEAAAVERIARMKYIVKGFGKPIYFGYAGKIGTMNPASLAMLSQDQGDLHNPEQQISAIEQYIEQSNTSKEFQKALQQLVKQLRVHVKAKKITYFDLSTIKQVLARITPPSLVAIYGKNRVMLGMELKGKEYTRLILGAIVILGLVAVIVVAILVLGNSPPVS